MKKEIKKGILFIALIISMIGYATSSAPNEPKRDINKARVSFMYVKKGQSLVIKSETGLILYKEKIKETGNYSKEFDLTSLPDGNYAFELEKEIEIQILPFKVSNNTVAFMKEKQESLFKPFVRFKGNQIMLSRLSIDDKPLKVELYYSASNDSSSDELIFSETIENKKVIERVYTLMKDKKGDYRIVMELDGRKFSDTHSL